MRTHPHPRRSLAAAAIFNLSILVGLGPFGVLADEAAAQLPSAFEAIELARSRECVGVLARVDALDAELEPLAERSQRLLAIGQAIALEEREVMDSLRTSDPLEAEVRAWFVADGELAQRYLDSPSAALLEQRSAARDTIQQRVLRELQSLDLRADSVIASTGGLGSESARCSGAVFLRPAVLEACAATVSPVCEAARDSLPQPGPYRFVESADVLWNVQELRAWSSPAPLQVLPTGQVGGARTVGLTRAANIVITLAFGPQIRRRVDLTPSEAARLTALTDSLEFGAGHPDLFFVPSLAISATIPQALDGETRYILHFGPPEAPDIVWVAPAGTGAPVDGVVELGVTRLQKLLSNEQLSLTALRPTANGENEPVYSIELTSLNQANAAGMLVQYMAQGLTEDLTQLTRLGAQADSIGAAPPDTTSTPR